MQVSLDAVLVRRLVRWMGSLEAYALEFDDFVPAVAAVRGLTATADRVLVA
jgi:hypothetical protein